MKTPRLAWDEALGLVLLLVAVGPTLTRVVGAWSDPIAEHGPVVVGACAWLVWRSRERLARTPRMPRPMLGAAILAVALWLRDAAALEPHVTITGPAVLAAVAGHVVARHGLGALRVLCFPLLFGLFALPAPGPALFSLAVHLKVIAAAISERVIDLFGVPVVRTGATLHVSSGALVVDDGCSGLRGLVAIVAFSTLLAYLCQSRRRAALGVLLAIPLALVANIARIVLMVILASEGHAWVLEGAAHEVTGLAVYAIALTGLFIVTGPPANLPPAPAETPPPADVDPSTTDVLRPPEPGRAERALLLGVVLLFASLSLPLLRPNTSEVTSRLPMQLGPFTGTHVPLEPVVFEVYGRDVAARRFRLEDLAAPLDLVVVHAVEDPWRAQHPPDVCFLVGGWDVVESGEVKLPTGRRAHRRLFRQGTRFELVYYWVQVGEREATNPLAMRLEVFSRRLRGERWAGATLVRLSTPVRSGDLGAADRRIVSFAEQALEPLDRALDLGGR